MGIYLILVALNAGLACAAIVAHWDYGATNFAAVFLTMFYLALMERWRPYRRDWHPSAREWRRDGLNLLIVFTFGALSQAVVTGTAVAMAPSTLSLPLLLEAPLAVLAASLVGYAFHRYSHSNRWLWMVHGIHHLPEKVNVANNMVVHFVEVFFSTVLTQIALNLLGVSPESALISGMFTPMQGYFIHANIDARLGRLNYILSGPEGHRLHHSRHVPEAGNFGSDLAVWDVLFGTMTWRPGRVAAAYGTEDEAQFPSTFNHLECSLYPFRGLGQLVGAAVRGGKKALHVTARVSTTLAFLLDLPDPRGAPGVAHRGTPATQDVLRDVGPTFPRAASRAEGRAPRPRRGAPPASRSRLDPP